MDRPLDRRRALRRRSTDAEALLWKHLRYRRFEGFKFRRQHPCGPYIHDFYCAEMRVAIELDGGQHHELSAQAYDARRTALLNREGIAVVRFPTDLVFRDLSAMLEYIASMLGADPSP
jgi:very-short-patch-repair endonuclease